jgi:hypothetical protein
MDMNLQVQAVKINTELPAEWNYDESVAKTQAAVVNWQNISAEILHELWVAREKLSQVGRPTGNTKTWADYCKDVGLSKSTVNRWLERFDAETQSIKPPKEEEVPEPDEGDFSFPEEVDDFDFPEESRQVDLDSYIKVLDPLIKNIRAAYKKLANIRNHTTPVAFSYFVGNLEEMAQRIETWTPKKMSDCPICEGKGFVKAPNNQGGETEVSCNNCINGKVGAYRESEY